MEHIEGPALVGLANDMLAQLHVPTRVQHWTDIRSSVFVTLFEGLCGESLPDVIHNPRCREDEIHNCQSVIDTLSLDILNTPLSHITGDDVVDGQITAIGNLLEVFSGLLEYIIDKIGSEPSTDTDDRRSPVHDQTDPDRLTPGLIDDILERELGRGHSALGRGRSLGRNEVNRTTGIQNSQRGRNHSPNARNGGRRTGWLEASGDLGSTNGSARDANSTSELIALGNVDSSWISGSAGSPNKTADLIALGDQMRYLPSGPRSPGYHDNGATALSSVRLSGPLSHTPPVRDSGPKLPDRPHTGNGSQGNGYGQSTAAEKLPSSSGTVSDLIQKSLELERSLGLDPKRRDELSMIASSLDNLRPEGTEARENRGNLRAGLEPVPGSSDPIQSNGSDIQTNRHHSSEIDTERNGNEIRGAHSDDMNGIAARINGTDAHKTGSTLDTGPRGLSREPPTTTPSGLDSSLASSLTLPRADRDADRSGLAPFDSVGVRPRPESDRLSSSLPMSRLPESDRSGVHRVYTHHLYHHYTPGSRGAAVSSLPVSSTFGDRPVGGTTGSHGTDAPSRYDSSRPEAESDRHLADRASGTAPTLLLSSQEPEQSSKQRGRGATRVPGSVSQSYENLENLMRDTVECARAAVKSSPLRERPLSDNASVSTIDPAESDDSRYRDMSKALRSALRNVDKESSEPPRARARARKTRQTNMPGLDTAAAKSILSPGKKQGEKKNVSFVTNKSLSSSENSTDQKRPSRPRKVRTKRPALTAPRTVQDSATNTTPHPAPSTVSPPGATAESVADKKPASFREYLLKYYGRERLRSSTSGEDGDGYDSDGAVNYKHSDDARTLEAEIEEYRRDLHRKSKAVRFDDILDDSAPGRMGGIRRKLLKEDHKTRFKTALLSKAYEEELMDHLEAVEDQRKLTLAKAKQTEDLYKKTVLKDPQTKHKPVRKYSGSVGSTTPRSRSKKRSRSSVARARRRSYSASPTIGRGSPARISDQEILPWLLEEFPYLHLSSETLQDLWRKSARQIEHLSKSEAEVQRRKSKAQLQIEEAERKQELMMTIMKKELNHNQKMRELKERRKQVVSVKSKIRDKRLQSVRCRRYYEDYQLRMRAKMLKKRSKEEMLFKKLYKEGLEIQKDRIGDLRRYAREQRQQRAEKQQQELESLENYYRDQFAMLAESMAKERDDLEIRESSQAKVLDAMKKDLRRKMEREIRDFQEQLYRDEDEAYFRELDADRLRHQLHMARYQTKV